MESLEAVTGLRFFSDDIKDRIDELSTFGVVALSPVISGPRLAKDKIVRSEDLSIGTISNTIHSARLKVDENGPGDVLATSCFIEVDIDALQLQVRVSLVGAGWVDTMFIRDDLPELGPNLVAALAGLEMDNLPHFAFFS